MPSSCIIVGAGPAGLTAAWELVRNGHKVTILESDPRYVGGLAKTINYKGFRFDIGAHRFYSKNQEIVRWWKERLPQDFVRVKRLTRILYRGCFFHYPLQAADALSGLGFRESFKCVCSYLRRQLRPISPEHSFRDWVVNRFGDRLYQIFFKTYTEKVWGIPCEQISADWASQRIKGLSLAKALLAAIGLKIPCQGTVKTLIDEFDYPRFGAGMLWDKTRDEILQHCGTILLDRTVVRIEHDGKRVNAVHTSSSNGQLDRWTADSFIISMPLRDCVLRMEPALAKPVEIAAKQLSYRDFILVALIVKGTDIFPDNWIYVHDPAVKVGRIENYNNWSSEMKSQPGVTCLEMEYFCTKNDDLWQMADDVIIDVAKRELEQLRLGKANEVMDGCVIRAEKAYPVQDSDYRHTVETIRKALAQFENLQTIGRNGMHKYNNQDHSMLTGMLAARNLNGEQNDVWRVNGDAEYLEEVSEEEGRLSPRRVSTR